MERAEVVALIREELERSALAARVRQLQGRVHGVVAANGTWVGSGFTVVKNGTGDYSVFFTTPFDAPPEVQLTLGSTATNPRGIKLTDTVPVTADAFRVWTYTVAPGLTDSEFHFSATPLSG